MTKKNQKKLIKIMIAMIVYIIAIVIDKLNILEKFYLSNLLFVISYLIVGFEILKKAFRNIIRGKVFDENFLMAIATLRSFCNCRISRSGGRDVILSNRGIIPINSSG